MDIVYRNAAGEEVGVMHNYSLDFEVSSEVGKNTFEIACMMENNVMDIGSYWYIQDTEYGGRVDSMKVDTATSQFFYGGKTWLGLLEKKVICPAQGEDYYIGDGDINQIIQTLIDDFGLSEMFCASDKTTEHIRYQFHRYTDVYSGIIRMLSEYGYKLSTKWDGYKVILSAKPVKDWAEEIEMNEDLFTFTLKKDKSYPNHIIGLGQGDLKERLVVHRYLDADGNISTEPYFTGMDEIVEIYDYASAEDEIELTSESEKKLLEMMIEDALDVSVNDYIEADVGDKFVVTNKSVDISVTQYVTDKITTITDTDQLIQYKVGKSVV